MIGIFPFELSAVRCTFRSSIGCVIGLTAETRILCACDVSAQGRRRWRGTRLEGDVPLALGLGLWEECGIGDQRWAHRSIAQEWLLLHARNG